MAIARINSANLHQTSGYAHVTLVDSGPLAVLAGQCPLGRDGNVVGRGDIHAQVDQVVRNAIKALAAGGAAPEDVIRSVIYVVSNDSSVLAAVWDQIMDSDLAPAFTTASTLLGVAALGYRDQLVEIDLTAALPDASEPEATTVR